MRMFTNVRTLDDLKQRIKNCQGKCKGKKNHCGLDFGYLWKHEGGGQRRDVMFVSHSPSRRCYQPCRDDPFPEGDNGDPACNYFLEQRRSLGVENSKIHMTDAVKCGSLRGRTLVEGKEWEQCKGLLAWEIWLVKPKLVVAMGGDAEKAIKALTWQSGDDANRRVLKQPGTHGTHKAHEFTLFRLHHYSWAYDRFVVVKDYRKTYKQRKRQLKKLVRPIFLEQ